MTDKLTKGLIGIIGGTAALGGAAWLGLKVPPAPFPTPDFAGERGEPDMLDLPQGLPEPVERYYRAVSRLPRVRSAYANGRGKIKVGPVWLPTRWELYLDPGKQFQWLANGTWYGMTSLAGGDGIIDGEAHFEMGPQRLTGEAIHKAEELALWAYTLGMAPSALLHLPGITWEAIDERSARLHYPAQDPDARPFTLHFDPASAALTHFTTERLDVDTHTYRPYKGVFGVRRSLGGTSLSRRLQVAWGDDVYFDSAVEHVVYDIPLPFPLMD